MVAKVKTKSLKDIQKDMSELYEQVSTGAMELKTAAELANIAGKYLKAEQLILAREIFLRAIRAPRRRTLEHQV